MTEEEFRNKMRQGVLDFFLCPERKGGNFDASEVCRDCGIDNPRLIAGILQELGGEGILESRACGFWSMPVGKYAELRLQAGRNKPLIGLREIMRIVGVGDYEVVLGALRGMAEAKQVVALWGGAWQFTGDQ